MHNAKTVTAALTLVAGLTIASSAALADRMNQTGQEFETPPPLQMSTPVVYVTGQDLAYDSFVVAALPMQGPFQELEMGGPTGLQTEFGPGDPGYLGGRWYMNLDGQPGPTSGDMYFLCPLLGAGYIP